MNFFGRKLPDTWVIVVLLMVIGFSLRFWQLGSLPAVVHRDEAAIGYNAYSLLQTGRDEHGVAWPLNFASFGEYKLPGMIYASVVSVGMFGLDAFAVRFPTALAAVLTIPALYWLVREMGWSQRVALLAITFLTFGFWHVSQARNAYEPMVGLLFSVTAWASWLAARRRWQWYIPAVGLYAVSALIYNVPFLLLPLLFLLSGWFDQRPTGVLRWMKQQGRMWWVALAATGLVSLTLLGVFRGVNASRSTTTVLSHPEIEERSQELVHAGLVGGLPSLVSRATSHDAVLAAWQVMYGYAAAFDPTYLFFLGDQNPWHNLRSIGLGNMNPVLFVWGVTGLYLLTKHWKRTESRLLAVYLLASPLVSALTIDAPITNRLLDFHIAVVIVAAVGADAWLTWMMQQQEVWKRVLVATSGAAYAALVGLFVLRYFGQFNPLLPPFWNPGLPQAVQVVRERADEYDWIFVDSRLDLAYIHFAFYTPFDPAAFQEQAQWYTSGFTQVGEYQQYRFGSFPDWHLLTMDNVTGIFTPERRKVLVLERGNAEEDTVLLWEDRDWRDRGRWYLWEADVALAITNLEKLPVTPERTEALIYLKELL